MISMQSSKRKKSNSYGRSDLETHVSEQFELLKNTLHKFYASALPSISQNQ